MKKNLFIAILIAFLSIHNGIAFAKSEEVKKAERVLDLKISFFDSCKKSDSFNPVYVSAVISNDTIPIKVDIKSKSNLGSSANVTLYPMMSDALSDKVRIMMQYTINSVDGTQEFGNPNGNMYFALPIESRIMQRSYITVEKSKPTSLLVGEYSCTEKSDVNRRYKLTLELL